MSRILLAILFSLAFESSAQVMTQAEMEADLAAHPEHLATRVALGNIYVNAKRYDDVIKSLNSYTDVMPAQGFLDLAASYSEKKDYNNEVRVLNLLTAKEETNYRWHMLLGQAYLKQADKDKDISKKKDIAVSAIQQFRKSLSYSPKYKPAYDILLNTLLQQKANGEAREILLEGLSNFGERPELYRELCRLDAGDGFLESAVANCRAAIKLAPNYPDNHVFLVQALNDQDEVQLAENDIVSAARKFPKSEFVQWAAGTLFFQKKNYPVANRYFKAAVAADGKSGRAHSGYAQTLFEIGDPEGALPQYVAACAANPKVIDDILKAGGNLKQKGNTKLGEKYIHVANTCHPTERKKEALIF